MEEIELLNYRCFKIIRLNFAKRINLLIGDNASGKTTLLKAIKSVLSSYFTGYSDEYTRFIGLSKNDFTQQETSGGLANYDPIVIHFSLFGYKASMRLESEKSRQATRTGTKTLSNIKQFGKNLKESLFDNNLKQVKELPLFASFSTEDIHSNRKLSANSFKQYLHKPSFGYYECLNGEGLFPYWIKRLLVLKEGRKGLLEIEGVVGAIKKALGPEGCNIIYDMQIRHNQGRVYYIFQDGREIETENLSDGYRRVVNIVTDLAFRCMLLNQGFYGIDACLKTKGTVLIDEIDLHLHPALQKNVLKGLCVAFPNLQFIISTHAPMVMTGIEPDSNNIIYKLTYTQADDYKVMPIELYGMDASSIIETALHTSPREKVVDEELKELFLLIDEDKYIEARNKLEQMYETFSNRLPELSKAETMLDFLESNEEN